MKSRILIIAALGLTVPTLAVAWQPTGTGYCTPFSPSENEKMECWATDSMGCYDENQSVQYYKHSNGGCIAVYSCDACDDDDVVLLTYTVPECSNTVSFKNCRCECNNCEDDDDWVAAGTGYQKMAVRQCECNGGTATCVTSYIYQCAAGYYGTSTNGTSGCTRCPPSGGVYGTSAAGSTAITSCYFPSGSSFNDATGSGTYTNNCYYKN